VKYRFTRCCAGALVVAGYIVIALGVVAAVAVAIVGPDTARYAPTVDDRLVRVAAALICVAAGFLVGALFIVNGQLLHVFLDQREFLAGIYRRLRKKKARVPEDDRTRLFPTRAARR